MKKSICVLARRADLTRDEFQDYYEHQHAPLGRQHFPFSRYVRNHLIDSPDIGFDTISEFWAEDIAALAGLMDGPVGEIMREDESRFMDRSRIAPGSVEEHVLSGGSTDRRHALLIDWADDADAAARADLLAWAGSIAANQPGVSVDFVQSWGAAFPARAVLWLPDVAGLPPTPEFLSIRTVAVRRCETPAAELRGNPPTDAPRS